MEQSESFDEANSAVKKLVGVIGDEVVSTISHKDDEGNENEGFACHRGTYNYEILGSKKDEYFTVISRYNFLDDVSRKIAVQEYDGSQEDFSVDEISAKDMVYLR